ncbi:hypothetical protein H5410_052454 [Solanum commersonii]|uniref:Uncharacterized protein n=1 Tax=Solanum commersonii TaxID=4109 RepID=A0A9J5X155_SOLCO|nr:hypothetical protein H5410_052454 [Solanum commersonii]
MDSFMHKYIVDKVRDASETWGFFQVVNHGIPISILDEMLRGARKYFEQDIEIKKEYYTRDIMKKVVHASNFHLYSPSVPAANWRDYFFKMAPNPPSPKEFPRPSCPQPELTVGTNKHSDNDFFTVFLQDHIGGLQMLHQNLWVDVPPTRVALVVNIGYLLQASFLFIF